MNVETVLEWELHAPDSTITFQASRDDDRYDLVMRRDEMVLLTAVAKDGATLLDKSLRLRSRLQELGYSAKLSESSGFRLNGGLCWGPPQPLSTSLLEVLA